MSYVVTIDLGAGAIDLTNYSGENLVLQNSFGKTETLYNKSTFKPDLNTADFEILLNTTLLASIMALDNDALVPVTITKDGSGWFKGFLRPVTGVKVKPVGGDTIEMSCVDMGWLLKERPATNAQKAAADDMTVLDTSSTSKSIVHWVLSEAGFTGTVYGDDITDEVDYMRIYYTDYFDALSEILFSHHHTFYFDGSGDFHAYNWGPDSITPASTIDDDNMIKSLNISRKDEDTNEVHVKSYRLNVANDKVMGSRAKTIYMGSYGESTFGPINISCAPPDERVEWYADTKWRYYEYNIINDVGGGIETYGRGGGWTYANTARVSVSATDHGEYWTLTLTSSHSGSVNIPEIQITGDLVTVGTAEEMKAGSGGKIKTFDAKYCYSTTLAAELAQSILDNLRSGKWVFKWTSQEDLDLGEHFTASNVAADVSSTVRILKKTAKLNSGHLFYEYEAVSTSAISAASEDVFSGEIADADTTAEVVSALASATAGLTPSGEISRPVVADGLPTTTAEPPGVSGLAFYKDRLGYYDATAGEWTAAINNDGTFIFKGDVDNYLEWDGATFTIKGDLAINGDVLAGDTVQSANFSAGSAGWQIDGDGSAEFESLIVRNIDSSVFIDGDLEVAGVVPYPPGHIYGLETSPGTDSDHDVVIAPGSCRSAGDLHNMKLASAITKRLDASWSAGSGNGGMFCNGDFTEGTSYITLTAGGYGLAISKVTGNMAVSDGSTIYILDGVSATVSTSFTDPCAGVCRALAFDLTGNLISADGGTIWVHSGETSTTTTSFSAPGTSLRGMIIDPDGNLVSTDALTDLIYIHSGKTATVSSSFATPSGNICGLAISPRDNLFSCDSTTGVIYEHDGISETTIRQMDDASGAPAGPYGMDFSGEALITGIVGADYAYIYNHPWPNATYHNHVIKKDSDGSIDAGWDTDIDCANIPTGYTAYRRIRSYRTDSSANIVDTKDRGNGYIDIDIPVNDAISVAVGSEQTLQLSVPIGVPLMANITASVRDTGGTWGNVNIYPTDVTYLGPPSNVASTLSVQTANDPNAQNNLNIWTDASAQVHIYISATVDQVNVYVNGWYDDRGQYGGK